MRPKSIRENGRVSSPSAQGTDRATPRGMGGIVGAFIAVLGLIVVVWGLTWLQHRPREDPARTVHYGAVLATARSQAPFRVLAPNPVPTGLRATSVRWDGAGHEKSWELGFVTSGHEFIGVYQGNGPAADVIAASTPATDSGPPVVIGDEVWKTLTASDRGETALVKTVSGVTTIVTGTADQSALAAFAHALR